MTFSDFDARMMARALRLAERGKYLARPNPKVGCVITKGSKILGEGYHKIFGQAHAEVNALADAKQINERLQDINDLRGTTVYVTLEPCAHQGKTGPCAQALIDAGVERVVCAMRDPNPCVNGGGFLLLQQAGITVASGLLEDSARRLNRGFIKRMTEGLPFVTIKMAASVDGRTAMKSGESQWITGKEARQDVQHLRAEQDAIVTGRGTLEQDNPSMNVRPSSWIEPLSKDQQRSFSQPLRIVIDRLAKANLQQAFFKIPSPIWWVGEKEYNNELPEHIIRKRLADDDGILFNLLKMCAENECNHVLVEAGARLAGEFVRAGLVDELVLYLAPKLMGSSARPLVHLPIDSMAESKPLTLSEQRIIGDDLRLTYSFKTR